ncbi:MAG: SPOR domain-containing protein [Candidatus Competibacteraceae bacterium]|nr:SPOR domain-containing protein [Candidatus Competibacteraceae bacterium]
MAAVNWKIPSLLAATLLAALGLQATAIKLMLDSGGPAAEPGDAVAHVRAAPVKPAAPAALAHVEPPVAVPAERIVERAAPEASAPAQKPAAVAVDPPPVVGAPVKADAPRVEPNPEAHPPAAPTPAPSRSPEVALLSAEAKPAPNPETPAAHPPVAAPTAETATAATPVDAPAASEPAVEGDLQDSAWLKGRDPKRYTVQLYSGKSLDALRAIAAVTASSEPQAYYTTGSRSGPWYSLVAGDFADAASAQAAAGKLTARDSTIKPWIRRFDEIQAKLR